MQIIQRDSLKLKHLKSFKLKTLILFTFNRKS
jgi:hypothetical protein